MTPFHFRIALNEQDKWEEVKGYRINEHFAIRKCDESGWEVTHLPTGIKAHSGILTQKNAVLLAKLFGELPGWESANTRNIPERTMDIGLRLYRMIANDKNGPQAARILSLLNREENQNVEIR